MFLSAFLLIYNILHLFIFHDLRYNKYHIKQITEVFQMSVLFLEYPKCSTCQKAKKWLDAHGVDYTDRHIKEQNPNADELREWYQKSGLPLKKFFNTSGLIYKEKQLKDKLPGMTEEEQLNLLAEDGMLVKRPLIIGEDFVLVGFKEQEWETSIG